MQMSSKQPPGGESGEAPANRGSNQVEKRVLVLYLIGLGFLVLSYLIPFPFSLAPLIAAVFLFVRGWLLSRKHRGNQRADRY
jgi:Na+/H+ antiporter NhaD/arsenite permease-like protein